MEVTGDRMLIEWDNGEKIYTSVKLQTNIIMNMEIEWHREVPKGTSSRRVPSFYGTEFSGLKPEDFKTNVEGTHWRSRDQLGGAVSKAILSGRLRIDSWATYRVPEVQWADRDTFKSDRPWEQAKFVASIDASVLSFGFYIERQPKVGDVKEHWNNWIRWLKTNDAWLLEVATEKCLQFFSPNASQNVFKGRLLPREGNWVLDLDGSIRNTTAYAFFSTLPETGWLGVVLGRHLPRDTAVVRAAWVAEDIADVFTKLMPMYEACISRTRQTRAAR